MPENILNIFVLLILTLWLFVLLKIVVRAVRNQIKTVKAKVVDKHKIETFSIYSGNGKREKYVIVFSVEGKNLSFYVSDFSYGGYKINETGTLKYKGDRIIDFS